MCIACTPKTQNEATYKIYKQAVELAKQNNTLVGIYTDERGRTQYVRAENATGYPIEKWVSPLMQLD